MSREYPAAPRESKIATIPEAPESKSAPRRSLIGRIVDSMRLKALMGPAPRHPEFDARAFSAGILTEADLDRLNGEKPSPPRPPIQEEPWWGYCG